MRIENAKAAPAVCLLLDLEPRSEALVAEIASQSFGMRTIRESLTTLFTRPEVHELGCVVADADHGSADHWSLPQRLYEHPSPLKVLFLVAQPKVRTVVDAFRCGAEDVIVWPTEREHLATALASACQSSAKDKESVERSWAAQQRLSQLTATEAEVLQLMIDGKANKNIANQLDISVRTVELRRKEIFDKLGTRNITEIYCMLQSANRRWSIVRHAEHPGPATPHFLNSALTPLQQSGGDCCSSV